MAGLKPTVEFGARVDRDDYLEFKANFPQHGATQWFIAAALKVFNRRCQDSVEITEAVAEAIDQMLDKTLKAGG